MSLRQGIRQTRLQARSKKPLPWSVYQVVATLVQHYALAPAFLQELATLDPAALLRRSHETPPCSPQLFPLLPPEQYELVQRLAAAYANPYLIYSRNPWEIRIGQELARQEPDLPPALLTSHSLTAIYQELRPK